MDEQNWYDELISEWDFEKNEKHISEYSKNSHKKVWWICKEYGHSYSNLITNRFRRGDRCSYCAGRKLLKGFNDLETKYPELAKEFDIEKNEILPSEIYPSKPRKVWWKCSLNHSWKTAFGGRIDGQGCPYCTNRKILEGFNDLATTHPNIAKEWNFEKNEILPTEITYGSPKSVWWKCSLGHEWKTAVLKRQTRNCPYCSNQKILQGYNDLATIHPYVAKEWNYEKNNPVEPTMVSPATPKTYWWKCSLGHEWKTGINSRVYYKTSCPYCSKVRILTGYNDLLTLYPELVEKYWDYEKNNLSKIYPDQIGKGSNIKVWWKCELGHSWDTKPFTRITMKDNNCVYCNNQRVLQGFNDLETKFPKLLKEWDYKRNDKSPTEYSFKSDHKVWWKCEKGHSWKTEIYTRTVRQSQCLRCGSGKHSSKPENDLMDFLESEYGEITTHTRKIISPYELDIYIPEKKIAIEFNGLYWHSEKRGKDKRYHYNKWKKCQEKEIHLITVWEDDWNENSALIKQKIKTILRKENIPEHIISDEEMELIQKDTKLSNSKNINEHTFNLQKAANSTILGAISGNLSKTGKIFVISDYISFSNIDVLKTMLEKISEKTSCYCFEYKISNDDNYFKTEVEEVFTEKKELEPSYKILINSQRYDKTDISVCKYAEEDPDRALNKVWDSGSQMYKLRLTRSIKI